MSDDGSPSLLNLRGFRIQKKPGFSHETSNGIIEETSSESSPEPPVQSVRRRIIPMSSSESDGDAIVVKNKDNMQKEVKEETNKDVPKTSKCESVNIESTNKDGTNKDSTNKDGTNKDSTNKDGTNKDSTNKDTPDMKPVVVTKSTSAVTNGPTYSYSYMKPKKSQEVLEKEKQMKFLREKFPSIDAMSLHDLLSKHKFQIEPTIEELNEREKTKAKTAADFEVWKAQQDKKAKDLAAEEEAQKAAKVAMYQQQYQENLNKKRGIVAVSTTPEKSKKKAKRMKTGERESDDSDFGNSDFKDTRVYDSDEESDVEISNELTSDKKKVLEFFQSATLNELQLMSSCSKKKGDAIMECRPFNGWVDLVQKLMENKNLSTDLLNAAQQVLMTRNNVQQLMRKCTNLAQQMERAVAAGAGVKRQPDILSTSLQLTSYQMIGLNWLAVMHAQGVNGILADEMGLGKTVQVIAFLAHLKETGGSKGIPHLIIVPSSTLDNWRVEFERWCPTLNVLMYYGSTEERKSFRVEYWGRGGLSNYDVILTTYTMVVNTPEERKMFRVTQMHYVVFDEAHMLKNMNTQRYENLIRIKAHNRILLTGTPLQNNLLELMSLLIFVMPTMFAGKTDDLKSLFQKNSRSGKKKGENDELPAFEKDQIAQAKRIMKPFVLRRLKRDVLQDLPKKTDSKVDVALAPTQKEQYDGLVTSFQSIGKEEMDSGVYSGMAMMSDLRKLSNHPLLLRYFYQYDELPAIAKKLAKDPNYKDTVEAYIVDDLACMSDFEIHTLSKEFKCLNKYGLPDNLLLTSGKFLYLDAKLKELKNGGHRVLIFSQYVIMLNVMEEYMKLRKHKYLRLDGSTPVNTRQQLIDEFSEDSSIFIFLLSTKAGGLGINLTAADTVIIHDIDFNPYNDKQAEDRCHRMGQTKPVRVYRLVSQGTIEEAMWEMNQEKLKLEREITTEESENPDVKSVVRVLSSALGIDSTKATNLVSPQKKS